MSCCSPKYVHAAISLTTFPPRLQVHDNSMVGIVLELLPNGCLLDALLPLLTDCGAPIAVADAISDAHGLGVIDGSTAEALRGAARDARLEGASVADLQRLSSCYVPRPAATTALLVKVRVADIPDAVVEAPPHERGAPRIARSPVNPCAAPRGM